MTLIVFYLGGGSVTFTVGVKCGCLFWGGTEGIEQNGNYLTGGLVGKKGMICF